MKKRGQDKKDPKGFLACTLFSKKNKAQMKLSFGMIFSIILIIIFISFAIYGVTKFLNLQKSIQTKKFADDFQFDVDKLWKANQGSQPVEYTLPKKITQVCFKTDTYGSKIELKKDGRFEEEFEINHVNIPSELSCISTSGGKVQMILKKEYGEASVTITE